MKGRRWSTLAWSATSAVALAAAAAIACGGPDAGPATNGGGTVGTTSTDGGTGSGTLTDPQIVGVLQTTNTGEIQ